MVHTTLIAMEQMFQRALECPGKPAQLVLGEVLCLPVSGGSGSVQGIPVRKKQESENHYFRTGAFRVL